MGTILDRMRLERRITVVILVVLMALALVYELFFRAVVVTDIDPPVVESGPAQGVEQ